MLLNLVFFDETNTAYCLGVQVTYDLSKPNGERVVGLKLRCLTCDTPRIVDMVPDASYTVLMASFTADGGDGYTMFRDSRTNYENLGMFFLTFI